MIYVLGSGTGGELTVNAPAGVTVIAVNSTTQKSYTKTANADGVAVFKGLPEGTYNVTISDGETTTEPVSVVVSYKAETTVAFFQATIKITYPKGSTCTCRNGSLSYTAPNTSGSWSLKVTTPGTWIVTCSNGIHTDTKNVYATSSGSYNAALSYLTYVVKDGVSTIGMPHNCFPAAYQENNYIVYSNTYAGTGVYSVSDFKESKISTRGYNTISFSASTDSGGGGIKLQLVKGEGDSEALCAEVSIKNSGMNGVDISSLNGDFTIRIWFMRNNGYPWYHLYSIWLE